VFPKNKEARPAGTLDALADENLFLEELLSTAAIRMRHLVAYDAIAVYITVGDILTPRLALGENMRQLSSLRIRMGEGLVGWVAETGNPIPNGNPAVELGHTKTTQKFTLRSALALPLRDKSRIVGVLALYRLEPDTFTTEHLRMLEPGCQQLGLAIRECLDRKQPQERKNTASVPAKQVAEDRSRSEAGLLMLD
jgi:putative methionine-R-sulfoxide reductase with GAF domain